MLISSYTRPQAGRQDGFTLLEALIAMVLLTIGVLALFPLQWTAIRGNSDANQLTNASARVQRQVEQIMSWRSDDPQLADTNAISYEGVHGVATADGSRQDGIYTLYWDGSPLMNGGKKVGTAFQVHAVWRGQKNRLQQVTMQVNKPL